jgi:3-isopropylmalate dehydrogenase
MAERSRQSFRIAVIAGDGIGPEVVDACLPAIAAAAALDGATLEFNRLPFGAEHYLETGETISDEAFERLSDDADAIFLGALGDPRVPDNAHARDILLGLRFRLDLYVNFRPCRLLHPDLCPLRPPTDGSRTIDFAIFRENTEGLYLGRGTSSDEGTEDEVHVAHEVHSVRKVERIITAAFAWAQHHGRTRITMADKSNAVPAHRLWGRLFDRVSAAYPDIEAEHRYVDALAMELVRNPDRFQVIVTGNLFGDILSDLGAELVGGLGLSPSANVHPGRVGLFEPVHGSAPPLVGTGTANPMAAALTGALMLDHLGLASGGARLEAAVRAALTEQVTTPDLGGAASTLDVGRWIADHIGSA